MKRRFFSAAYVLAFFGFFRVGELTVPKQKSKELSRVLSVNDVSFVKGAMLVTIRYSKTDQRGSGTTLKIYPSNLGVCPVNFMCQFLRLRPKVNGPLFCHLDEKPLTRYQFTAVLQKTLRTLHPDLVGYRSHSFRIGAAVRAASLGWPSEN